MKKISLCLLALILLLACTALAETDLLRIDGFVLGTGYYKLDSTGHLVLDEYEIPVLSNASDYDLYFNESAGQLTLNNATLNSSILAAGDLELILNGTNKVTSSDGFGIQAGEGGDFVISGSGTLDLVVNGPAKSEIIDGYVYVIQGIVVPDSDFTMESGTVTVTLKDPDTLSEQSEALAIFEGNMEMSGGSMTLKASNATNWSYGLIISEGNLTITNGTLDVTAGSTSASFGSSQSVVLYSGNITVSGGTLNAVSGSVANDGWSSGISCASLDVNGGSVTGNAGKGEYSIGIDVTGPATFNLSRSASNGEIVLSKGNITGNASEAELFSYGISAYDITMTGGTMTGNAGNAEDSNGISTNTITMNDGIMTGNSTNGIGINYTSANLSGELVEREPDSDSDQIRPENSSSTGDASHPILWALMIAFACFAVMFSKKRVHA